MRGRRVGVAAAFLVMIAAGAVTGCSASYNDQRGKGDASVQGGRGDDTPAQVFNMPDGFGNLATKCVGHGYRAYVTTNATGPSNVEIVPDETCTG
ncbi:hypothetical protein [Streptomyces genisteinicus]|uniref:Lipoprotein n=1 Tax=Streptomyces genisteinicus TaxID=2768068 RepID=A0A7H0I091_9ACTN|nr:hypothetical protein [Streptomyces genisteinicus]QNP66207.1 hypothetical protein IAG43_26935 [Streptomyces genisteinicus]